MKSGESWETEKGKKKLETGWSLKIFHHSRKKHKGLFLFLFASHAKIRLEADGYSV